VFAHAEKTSPVGVGDLKSAFCAERLMRQPKHAAIAASHSAGCGRVVVTFAQKFVTSSEFTAPAKLSPFLRLQKLATGKTCFQPTTISALTAAQTHWNTTIEITASHWTSSRSAKAATAKENLQSPKTGHLTSS
jgi:hypothetical protein